LYFVIPVPVALVSVPLIGIERVNDSAEPRADVDARENDLITDDSPGGTTVIRLRELAVEPVLLVRTHETAAGVIMDFSCVMGVPV